MLHSRPRTLMPLYSQLNHQSESESELLYDWRFTSNQFVLAPSPLRLTARYVLPQLNTCGHSPYITSSLKRGWVCHLQLLLAHDSAFILGSESRWTCGHMLLSQIWDFPFRCLLRLAGSRWRYSTPLPHSWNYQLFWEPRYIASARTTYKTPLLLLELLCYLPASCSMVHREHSSYFCVFAVTCILSRCLAMVVFVTIWITRNSELLIVTSYVLGYDAVQFVLLLDSSLEKSGRRYCNNFGHTNARAYGTT
jgi:hypothetical protein